VNIRSTSKKKGTPIPLPNLRRIWIACIAVGVLLWIIGLFLWGQKGVDNTILFYFNAMRISKAPIVILSKWLSSYGMAVTTVIFIVYLIISQKVKSLDATLTFYLYTIFSFALSGIAGDLLKVVFARPRPLATFGSEIMVLSQAVTPAIPSGHATKSIALILPFILLVSNSRSSHKAIKVMIALIAGGVCISRFVLGAHYLSDVIAGIGTAFIGLPFSIFFANMILRRNDLEHLPTLSKIWGVLLIFLTIIFMML
jgi:membrane-associated phospholipid phosphatase